ncbi:EmrB/QacA subfamily drug resistance transporter [Pullulanibacillus pueri]|uniref:Putative MFS-type transporter YhcA n=1 Tax=Pullulanibacillus pueri TaxID=1437324 RepID=A0A8J2ZWI9_9BACL|nr:DHA2 family efflux MFS transporter permease subunit [Pullulanibacillus pueri]MBM7682816.1 EmrB/QacA subfamily drug resistance transporter [Pullulanibacillus pueri]GGH83298.1 putative MFS-type transporter YhcA [Pullulanibacillus pueri]
MTSQNSNVEEKHFNPIAIMAVMVAGAFVALLNQTLMNVALPKIMTDLEIGASTGQWLTTAFMLVNGVLIPVTAFLMQRFTTRQLYITAMGLFAAGTLICALAPGFDTLIAGRVVQAAGAGIMMPLLTNTLLTIFPIEKRGSAMGVMGIAMIFAPAVGPTLSGWIVQNYSWRVLFYIILPIAVIDIILSIFVLKNVGKRTFPKIDIISIILSTLGFGGLLYGFSTAGTPGKGWGSVEVIVTLVGGAFFLLLFIWKQMVSKVPMLEFRVFKYWMFTLSTLINVIITMAMFAAMIIVPLYLQDIRGFTPLKSGLLLLPGAILMGIMSPITGKIFDKIGPRWLAVVGLAITVVTTYEFSNLTDSMSYTTLIVLYSARMFGMSMLMMPIMTAGLNALPQKWNAHGTAMVNTIRMISGSIGTAILVTVMTNHTITHMQDMLKTSGIAPKVLGLLAGIDDTTNLPQKLAAQGVDATSVQKIGHILSEATIQGMNDAFVVATILSLVAFVLAFLLRKNKPVDEGENKEHQSSKVPASDN